MADVYKRPNSPFWYYDVTVNGKRQRRSTGRTNKSEARTVQAAKLKAELDKTQLGFLPELTLKQALFDHYLPTMKGRASYRHLECQCRKMVNEFGGVEGFPGITPFHDMTTTMLRQYRARRQAQDAADWTIDHELKVVSAAYNLLKEDYRVRQGLRFPMARPKGKPRFLMESEEEALLTDLSPTRHTGPMSDRVRQQREDNYDLAVMLLDTGCRFGEIANLSWSMVDTIDWSWLHIYRTKVDNEGRMAMTARVRETLKRRWANARHTLYVFPGWAGAGGDDAPRTSTAAIRRAMKRVGINHPANVARFGKRDVRSLRDTFATKLRVRGMSLDRIQKLLGHASPAMTQKYADLGVDVASTEAASILDAMGAD